MSKSINLTEREMSILDGLIVDEIEATQDSKRSARTRITNLCGVDDVVDALSEYDYFIERLHTLYMILDKLREGGEVS